MNSVWIYSKQVSVNITDDSQEDVSLLPENSKQPSKAAVSENMKQSISV